MIIEIDADDKLPVIHNVFGLFSSTFLRASSLSLLENKSKDDEKQISIDNPVTSLNIRKVRPHLASLLYPSFAFFSETILLLKKLKNNERAQQYKKLSINKKAVLYSYLVWLANS